MRHSVLGWIVALSCAIAIHVALLIGLEPQKHGALEKPSGATVTVSGSLARVLGGATIAEVAEHDSAKPVKTKETEPTHTAVEAVQTHPTEGNRAFGETQAASAVTSSSAIEALSETQEAITSVQTVDAKSIEEIKPVAIEKKQLKLKKTFKGRSAKRREKKSKKSRAGSRKKNSAGTTRGEGGGKGKASAGSIQGYASRVRARILSRRPSATGRGRVVVSFAITQSGGLRYATVRRGSGNATLDRAALAAVRRASPFPRPPVGASAHQLRFSIPFSFR